MTWGAPMMVFDPKKGKPVLRQPKHFLGDSMAGRLKGVSHGLRDR